MGILMFSRRRAWFAFFCLLVGPSCPAALSHATLLDSDPALQLWFNFDQDFSGGQVMDVTGNGHTGWRFCATNWITTTNGVFGTTGAAWHTNSTALDGTTIQFISQYIGVTNLAGIQYLTNGTISLWAQFGQGSDAATVLLDAGYAGAYAVYPQLATNSWSLRRDYDPYLSFILFDATTEHRTLVNWPTDVVEPGGYNPDLSTTNFHLYSITFSCTSNQAIAYYDGLPFMTNSIGLPWLRIYCSTPWLAIGAMSHDGTPQWGDDPYPHSGFFDGRMDDIRIYNRALSASEVQSLFTGSSPPGPLYVQRANPGSILLSWPAPLGQTCQLQVCSNLVHATWSPLGSAIPGNGTTNTLLDSTSGRRTAFYRLLLVP